MQKCLKKPGKYLMQVCNRSPGHSVVTVIDVFNLNLTKNNHTCEKSVSNKGDRKIRYILRISNLILNCYIISNFYIR